MISINELKPGITFENNSDIFVVISSYHSKQARSKALVKTKIKNLRTGSILWKSFNSKDKIEKINIRKKKMVFLYNDQRYLFLMDEQTFEKIEVPIEKFKWQRNFLNNNSLIMVKKFNKEILDIELDANVKLKVTYSPDATKGNTHNNAYKKVKLENNFELEVPLFIKEKDVILVSSKNGKYVGKIGK